MWDVYTISIYDFVTYIWYVKSVRIFVLYQELGNVYF